MSLKIGYQGTPGSYTEVAAHALMSGIDEVYDLMPLTTSARVAERLRSGAIAYGVAAVENSTAGVVEETRIALPEDFFLRLAVYTQPIHHCLFLKDQLVKPSQIERVVSHEQALRQCEKYIKANFPNAKIVPTIDTALAAENLAGDTYGAETAVICSRQAGISRHLRLLAEAIQDRADNRTTFGLFYLKQEAA